MAFLFSALLALLLFNPLRADESAWIGRWALDLPDGKAGWLGIEPKGNGFAAEILWVGGSVLPADDVTIDGPALTIHRTIPGKHGAMRQILTGQLEGSEINLTSVMLKPDGAAFDRAVLRGHRIPDLPPPPDLRAVKFGPPIQLISGGLSPIWVPVDARDPNGWTLVDGVLSNRVTKGKTRRFANLRTQQVFEDFELTAEVRTLPESNSGIFLRGVYEIQIAETYGKPLDSHNMGALYSRITPSVAAEKPIGEWQTLRIILVQRHITVVLNGTTIIDNKPALGCTGGALTSDEMRPGPVMLQGDHSDIDYRKIVIRPVVKNSSALAIVAATDRARILASADAALELKPFSITDYRAPLSDGGPHDFFSMSDYFWPDPAKPDGKPYIQRDGESYPGNFNAHRLALMGMRDATSALAAAYQLTQDERYAAKATELLRVFFVDPATRMDPSLEYAQVMIGQPAPTRGIGLIDTLHLIEVPMSVQALEGSRSFTPAAEAELIQWFRDYVTWLTKSPRGRDEGSRTNNHAVAYWLQIAAYNQLVGDRALREQCLHQFKDVFVGVQMAPDGSFPLETRRTKPYAYSIFQLDNLTTLCLLLSPGDKSLWNYSGPGGRSIRQAMAWIYPYLADKSRWPFKPDVQAWDEWPVRQVSLIFGGRALAEPKYVELWQRLKPDPQSFEIRRNNAVTQPLLWVKLLGE